MVQLENEERLTVAVSAEVRTTRIFFWAAGMSVDG